MGAETFIAGRYLWSGRRHPFVGIINLVSIAGISLGVAILIIVMAVMNGFDQDLKDRLIGMRSHLSVEREGPFTEHERVIGFLKKTEGVRAASPFVQGEAVIQKGEWGAGILVRGVDTRREKSVSKLYGYFTEGTLPDRAGAAAIGSVLADKARLALGSEFSILSGSSKKPMTFRVEGIFSSGMYEYDERLVFMGLKDAQELFGIAPAVSGLSVRLEDADGAARDRNRIQKGLGREYFVMSWMDMNKALMGALRLEKTVMFLILALIILVASLNVAGSLTILVISKTKDIGVLKALGMTSFDLVKVFALNGFFLGAGGALAGLAAGMGGCYLIQRYGFVEMPKEIYFGVERLPVSVDFHDVLAVLGVAVALGFFSSFYPALMAGRLDPVKALRYE